MNTKSTTAPRIHKNAINAQSISGCLSRICSVNHAIPLSTLPGRQDPVNLCSLGLEASMFTPSLGR